MKKGQQTRERILSIAEAAILEKGFGATSIEEVIEEAGITKSGFFYHFRDKNELALALIERHIASDNIILNDLFERAGALHDDPLHQFLIGLKLFADLMNDIPSGHPGCLVATFCYQERLFDKQIHELNREAVLIWRRRFRKLLDEIVAIYPMRDEVDLDDVADMISSTVEGGIVISKALKDPAVLGNQLLLLRSYIKLLFSPTVN
jgi:AcrR family transcriptional regulator